MKPTPSMHLRETGRQPPLCSISVDTLHRLFLDNWYTRFCRIAGSNTHEDCFVDICLHTATNFAQTSFCSLTDEQMQSYDNQLVSC